MVLPDGPTAGFAQGARPAGLDWRLRLFSGRIVSLMQTQQQTPLRLRQKSLGLSGSRKPNARL
jgi:hypothetical protein